MTLTDHIATHRELYRHEIELNRLAVRQPPMTRDERSGEWGYEPAAASGLTVAARLLRLIGHPDNLGDAFPWRSAWWRLRYHCRENHRFHYGRDVPYWRGSLCQEIVRLVVMGPERRIPLLPEGVLSVHQASKVLRYDDPEPILRFGLDFIVEDMDHHRAKAEERAQEVERLARQAGATMTPSTQPVVVHHAVPGMHQDDCPVCRRVA